MYLDLVILFFCLCRSRAIAGHKFGFLQGGFPVNDVLVCLCRAAVLVGSMVLAAVALVAMSQGKSSEPVR